MEQREEAAMLQYMAVMYRYAGVAQTHDWSDQFPDGHLAARSR